MFGHLKLSTVLAFDIGVYLVVVGLVLMVFEAFGDDYGRPRTRRERACLAFAAATLFGVGTYLVLQRKLSRIIIGLGLLTHGANVLLMTSGRAGDEPLIGVAAAGDLADPLPHAMALTAIVITFGVSALLLAMAFRSWILRGDDEVENDVADTLVARGGVESKDVTDEERAEQETDQESGLAVEVDRDERPRRPPGVDPADRRRPLHPPRAVAPRPARRRADRPDGDDGAVDRAPRRRRPRRPAW